MHVNVDPCLTLMGTGATNARRGKRERIGRQTHKEQASVTTDTATLNFWSNGTVIGLTLGNLKRTFQTQGSTYTCVSKPRIWVGCAELRLKKVPRLELCVAIVGRTIKNLTKTVLVPVDEVVDEVP